MTINFQTNCPTTDKNYVSIKLDVVDNALHLRIETFSLYILSVNTTQYNSDLIALYGDKEINKFVGNGSTQEGDKIEQKVNRWISRWGAQNPFAGVVVIEKATNQFVGSAILKPVKDRTKGEGHFIESVAEIGAVFKKSGLGYGPECNNAVLNHYIPQLIEKGYKVAGHPIKSVMATARTDNYPSISVMKKFMEHTGTKERYNGMREWFERKYS